MSAITFYHNDGRAANGHSYAANLHRYGAVCASNHWPLGSVIVLTGRGGRRLRVTVCDRVGHGTDYDLNPAAFRKLGFPLKKGRGSVRARLVRRPHKHIQAHKHRRKNRGGGSAPCLTKSRRATLTQKRLTGGATRSPQKIAGEAASLGRSSQASTTCA